MIHMEAHSLLVRRVRSLRQSIEHMYRVGSRYERLTGVATKHKGVGLVCLYSSLNLVSTRIEGMN
jgi:hypothetical protein